MTTMPTQILEQPVKTMVDNVANTQNSKCISPGISSNTSTPMNSPSEKCIAPTVINGREARNLAEKQRRDKLNASIGELAKMVPHVADSPRRLDKTTVLRYATHGLRLQYVFGKTATRRKVANKCDSSLMTNALLHLLDSFFITLTCHGQIVLISSSVEHLLGHCQSDLYGQNLLQITHPDDQEKLQQELIPSDIESIFFNYHNSSKSPSESQQNDKSSNISQEQNHSTYSTLPNHQINKDDRNCHHVENSKNFLLELDEKLRADKRCFTVRLARASSRSDSKKVYEIVKIDGCFRRSDFSALATGSCSYPIVSQLIRRSRNNISNSICGGSSTNGVDGEGKCLPILTQHNAIAQAALYGVSGNDIVLVAMARIIRPAKIMNYSLEANGLEYKTRHLIDGRIVDCDNRIGLVAGYLKDEVRNLCPFSFIHQDDVRWVIVALRQMYDSNSDYGESCYRLLSRNGSFIYLNTKGYLEIDKSNNKVHSFICVNTLLGEEDGKQKVQEMKNKFSIIINAKVPTNTTQDVPASQNPQQLERIVLYLIENLQKRQINSCIVDEIHSEDDVKRHAAIAPHLSLVPPEPESVKSSISKSVSVIIATAAKSFEAKSYVKENETNTNNTNTEDFAKNNQPRTNISTQSTVPQHETVLHRPSVLQMRAKLGSQGVDLATFSSPDLIHKNAQHISLLKRMRIDNSSTMAFNDDGECCKPQPVKRSLYNSSSSLSSQTTCLTTKSCSSDEKNNETTNFHDFISSSLRHVGETLDCIDVQTSNLRQNCSSLPYSLDNKLDAIIIEQKKQNKFLVNIKNEYEVYREQRPKFLKNSKQKRNQHQKHCSPDKL